MQNETTFEAKALPEKRIEILYGYLLLGISSLLYGLFEWLDLTRGEDFAVFVTHYLLAGAYVVVLLHYRSYGPGRSWRKENLTSTVILLNLFLISAYALNRSIPVFEKSADWFTLYLIVTSLNLLSFRFAEKLPARINAIQYFILGSTLVLYFYMALYVSNVYIVGSLGILAFGIGAHIFVPLTMLVVCITIAVYAFRERLTSFICVLTGVVISFVVVGIYTATWSRRVAMVEKITSQSVLHGSSLPAWTEVAQNLPVDALSEKILKSDLVYSVSSNTFGGWSFMPKTLSWQEAKSHDPLVFIASMFAKSSLSREDKIKILKTRAERHRGEDRLWSGDYLATSYVISDIDLYPDLRLSYTEKYLTIKNESNEQSRWRRAEEAIYTFQLPEGSVITSLSLWIDGKEEKAILTSKKKAKKAYNTIVGVETRDPSVIQWQEGNTVSVRVFPCTVNEERKFKIGITSPLAEDHGSIVYKNPVFKGPNAAKAKETIRVRIIGPSADIELPRNFKKDKKGNYLAEQSYDPDFRFSLPAIPLKNGNRFEFGGYEYSLHVYQPVLQKINKTDIYLDINKSWTNSELDQLKELSKQGNTSVYVDDEFILLNTGNWDDIVPSLQSRSFSLFPFHLLKRPAQSLVITKGVPLSIQLADFSDSDFAKDIAAFFASGKKPYVYNLGTNVSTYIASMRELRGFEFAQGDVETLMEWQKNGAFSSAKENDGVVILHDSRLTITKQKIGLDSVNRATNAPDHVARLFAYNDIMRKIGPRLFKKDFVNDTLVQEAASAYVVSPVSSLIVLESQEDYKRFGIEDTENSLHNAAKNSSGAVPEPHEWALIIFFLVLVVFKCFRGFKLKTN